MIETLIMFPMSPDPYSANAMEKVIFSEGQRNKKIGTRSRLSRTRSEAWRKPDPVVEQEGLRVGRGPDQGLASNQTRWWNKRVRTRRQMKGPYPRLGVKHELDLGKACRY